MAVPSDPQLTWPDDPDRELLENRKRYPTFELALAIYKELSLLTTRKTLDRFIGTRYEPQPSRWLDKLNALPENLEGSQPPKRHWRSAKLPDHAVLRLIWSLVHEDTERARCDGDIADILHVLVARHPSVKVPHLLRLSFLPRDLLGELERFYDHLRASRQGNRDNIRRSALNPQGALFADSIRGIQQDAAELTGKHLPGDQAIEVYKRGWRSHPSLKDIERRAKDLGLGERPSAWAILVIPLVSYLKLSLDQEWSPGPYKLVSDLLRVRYPSRFAGDRWGWTGNSESVRELYRTRDDSAPLRLWPLALDAWLHWRVTKAIEGESAYGEAPSPLPQAWFTATDIAERIGLADGHAKRVARKLALLHQKAERAASASVHSLEAFFDVEGSPIRYRPTSPSEVVATPAAQEAFPLCEFCHLPFRPAPGRVDQRYGDNCCGSEKPHRAPTENDPGCPGHDPSVTRDENRDGSRDAP